MPDDELLDWTVADAPRDEAEAGPAILADRSPHSRPPQTERSTWTVPRRMWVLVGGVVLVALGTVTIVLPRLEIFRARRAVGRVLLQEAQAIAAEDWQTLRTLYDPDAERWAFNQVQQIQNQTLPPPLQAYGAWPLSDSGRLHRFTLLNSALARADVARDYALLDGRQLTLVLPQYYRYAQGGWQRTPFPNELWGEVGQRVGAWVDLEYNAADAQFAAELGAYLDELVEQACRAWACPAGTRVKLQVYMALTGYTSPAYFPAPPFGSLTFAAAAQGFSQQAGSTLLLPSPQMAGYPLGEPSSEAIRRAVGARVLVQLARQLIRTPADFLGHGNSFFYALVAREAVRLGLEPPSLATVTTANPVFEADQLWSLNQPEFLPQVALPQALAALNSLLASQPQEADDALFRGLNGASDPITWLAAGLALTSQEAQSRWAAAMDPPMPTIRPGPDRADLALTCYDGPYLASSNGQAWPLLEGYHPDSRVDAWSPDGRRLALSISGRAAVVDLPSETGQWLPLPLSPFGGMLQWASESLVVYEPLSMTVSGRPSLGPGGGLHFFDLSDPDRVIAPLADFRSYWPSPTRKQAIVASAWGQDALLSVVPTSGGVPVQLGTGYGPAWSPDGWQVVYIHDGPGNARWSLLVADTTTGQTRSLLDDSDPRVPAAEADGGRLWIGAAWSPSGDEIAVSAVHYSEASPFTGTGWVGLLAADGSRLQILSAPDASALLSGGSFSADGRYLLVGQRQGRSQRPAIYDLKTDRWLRSLPGYWYGIWSPAGHRLALADRLHVSLLAEPADPQSHPRRLDAEACYGVSWRPAGRHP